MYEQTDCKTVGFLLKVGFSRHKVLTASVTLSIFSLAPELSFDYLHILDFAEMRTVLQSNKHKEKLITSSKCKLHVYLLPFWTLWRFRFFACFLLQLKGTKQPHIVRFTTPQNMDFKKLLKGDIMTLLWSCSCFSFVSFFKQLLHTLIDMQTICDHCQFLLMIMHNQKEDHEISDKVNIFTLNSGQRKKNHKRLKFLFVKYLITIVSFKSSAKGFHLNGNTKEFRS